jgi:hypothetical protein
MTRERRAAALILLGVAMLVLSIIVWVANRGLYTDLLAAAGVAGGLGLVVSVLPGPGNTPGT